MLQTVSYLFSDNHEQRKLEGTCLAFGHHPQHQAQYYYVLMIGQALPFTVVLTLVNPILL